MDNSVCVLLRECIVCTTFLFLLLYLSVLSVKKTLKCIFTTVKEENNTDVEENKRKPRYQLKYGPKICKCYFNIHVIFLIKFVSFVIHFNPLEIY